MFRLTVQLIISMRAVLAYAPSNRLMWHLRRRRGMGAALIAVAVGAVYLLAAATCAVLIDRGSPGWLNVLVLLFIWNALKLAVTGPATLVASARKWLAGRHSSREAGSAGQGAGGNVVSLHECQPDNVR
jgi:hypothetical protein